MTGQVIYCLKDREVDTATFGPDCLVVTDQSHIGRQAAEAGSICIAVAGGDISMEGFYPWAELLVEDVLELDEELLEQTWCHGRGEPWRVAEGKRIYLQELTVEAVPELYRIYHQQSVLAQVQEMTGTLEEERIRMKEYCRYAYRFYGYGIWGIYRKEDDRLLGSCGLELKEYPDGPMPELGYVLDAGFRGLGFATEAATLALEYGHRIGYDRICARIAGGNRASMAVAERIGMYPAGTMEMDGKEYQLYESRRGL